MKAYLSSKRSHQVTRLTFTSMELYKKARAHWILIELEDIYTAQVPHYTYLCNFECVTHDTDLLHVASVVTLLCTYVQSYIATRKYGL